MALDRGLVRTVGVSIPCGVYERLFARDLRGTDVPAVFVVERVAVDRIQYVSGRASPWRNRAAWLGRVLGGSWDREVGFDLIGEPLSYTHVRGDRIVDWPLYRSIADRVAGSAWEETPLVELAEVHLAETPLSRRYTTREGLRSWLNHIDALIASIDDHGLQSRATHARLMDEPMGVLECHLDEIFVDVGRDGQLLFVDGKHRMCIAKALGLETVPVARLVRHRDWIVAASEPTGRPSTVPD